ncbi:ABC transporter ATP-binding protein/permease [Candidatus Pelagibacter ubique]|jgi:ATP-binding cassette, subfamily B, bacterial PglK|nr:ABC transporter ATP-binding protein/permease [Candidatus Pelagibacter ubique]
MKILNQFYSLLSSSNKTKLNFLAILIAISTVLEGVSIGSILPTLGAMTYKENYFLNNIEFLKNLKSNFGEEYLIIVLMYSLIGIFILKNIFFIFKVKYQSILIAEIEKFISKKLYVNYLNNNFHFFTKRNSSDLLQICVSEAAQFSGYALHFTNLISEISIAILIIAILFVTNFSVALYSFLFLLIVGTLLYFYTKTKIEYLAKVRQYHESERLKILKESFLSIREIKILGTKKFFIKIFDIHNNIFAEIKNYRNYFAELPRIFFEISILIGIVIFLFFFSNNSELNIKENIPIIGIYVIAIFRLIPSANRIGTSLQKIKFSKNGIEKIFKEMKQFKKIKQKIVSNKLDWNKIEYKNLTYIYNNNIKIFNNLNFNLKKGEVLYLEGKSGSGKTTLINIICGLLKPSSGKINLDGSNKFDYSNFILNKVSLVPQDIYLFNESIEKNITMDKSSKIKKDKLKKILKTTGLDNLNIKKIIKEDGKSISGGQRKRIGIARALYKDSDILILDEATSELDMESEKKVIENIIKNYKNLTLIIISHNKVLKEYANNCINLS